VLTARITPDLVLSSVGIDRIASLIRHKAKRPEGAPQSPKISNRKHSWRAKKEKDRKFSESTEYENENMRLSATLSRAIIKIMEPSVATAHMKEEEGR